MGRIIAVANHKGGVGKTSTTLHLGHALAAEPPTRVLLVDLDPQASLTKLLGFTQEPLLTIARLLSGGPIDPGAQVIQPTAMAGVDLLPSSSALTTTRETLVGKFNRERTLQKVLRPLSEPYQFVLIDCPPSLDLLTTNALTAADEVLVPIESEFLPLQALGEFLATVQTVREELNPTLKLSGIVVTKHQAKTQHAQTTLKALREAFPQWVFQSVIPHSVKAKDSVAAGQSIFSYAPASRLAEAYRNLAHELTHPHA